MDAREIDINKVKRVVKALLKNGDQKRAALVIEALKKKCDEDNASQVIYYRLVIANTTERTNISHRWNSCLAGKM